MGRVLVNSKSVMDKLKNESAHNISVNKIIDFKNLSEYEKNIYYLYECSDDLLVDEAGHYPSIVNYLKTSLLTEEEIIQALLYK